jgi:hypothetical protein
MIHPNGPREVWALDAMPDSGPAWHTLPDDLLIALGRMLRAGTVGGHAGRRRWLLSAAEWEWRHRKPPAGREARSEAI